MTDELRNATVEIGNPGLNGGGVTASELTAATADRAPNNATYITQTANATLTAEQALSSLSTGLLKVTTGTGVLSTAVGADIPPHGHTGVRIAVPFLIDGGVVVIPVGIKGDIQIPHAATITEVRLLADQVGSMVLRVWNSTYVNYPPTSASVLLTMSLVSANKVEAVGLSIAVASGDVLRYYVESATTVTRVTAILVMDRGF